jgi:hypothetical protein
MRTLAKWAFHVNLNCPTVTFKGINPVEPSKSTDFARPSAADGWKPGTSEK